MMTSEPGLCVSCAHVRRVETRRGSVFYRCQAAEHDVRLPRYPRLPVRVCFGYSPAVDDAAGAPPEAGADDADD